MDIKKVSVKDVYNTLQQNLEGIYAKLQKSLGDDNPFASCQVGNGFYVWSHPSAQWMPMYAADVQKQAQIRDAKLQLKDRIASMIGAKTTEALFLTPDDDSYVFYNEEGGAINILITGWGFKYPKTPPHKRVKVSISFLYDGVLLPNYEFNYKDKETIKQSQTDANGIVKFELWPGKFTVIDPKCNREFDLNIYEDGRHYDIDVTQFITVDFSAIDDGKPIVGEKVHVDYHGKTYDCTTDTDGRAGLQLPFHQGATVEASLRDQQQTLVVQEQDNFIAFEFVPDVIVPDIVETDINVIVKLGGEPVSDMQVHVNYGEQTFGATTDAAGTCAIHVQVIPDVPCNVSVVGYPDASKPLVEEGENLFVFDKEQEQQEPEEEQTPPPPTPIPPVKMQPHIKVEGNNGFIGSRYPIIVEYGGQQYPCMTDDNGIVQLPEMICGTPVKVTDGIHANNIRDYVLEEGQDELLFQIPYEPDMENKDIKVMLRDVQGRPVMCEKVCFRQGATERLVQLDAQGDTYFSKDTFQIGQPIDVLLIGSSKDYGPINFTMDEGETEYLLQENNKKSSPWMIVLEILLVLLVIAVLFFLWPYLMGAFEALFDMIY